MPSPKSSELSAASFRRRARLGLSMALGGILVLSCGGSPTSAPGAGAANLPPQTNPGVKDADKDKDKNAGPKRNLKGNVVDAITGEPIEKATLFIEGVVTTVSSTPIPSTPSPGADDKPANGSAAQAGQGSGGGSFQLAQSDPDDTLPDPGSNDPMGIPSPTGPDATSSPDPFGSPTASASPGSSPKPGASPAPNGKSSPAPNGKDGDASAPTPTGTPFPLTPVQLDSRGKFEIKDLPEGSYSMTVWAPGYQAQTFQGNIPAELEVQLRPLDPPKTGRHELKGVARLANNQPAPDIEVEISSLPGKFPGLQTTTDDAGNFTLPGLVSGSYAVAGWTTNLEGEVETFAIVKEVPVSLGREKRTVSPTLVLRAVTTPLLLAGTVEGTVTEAEEKAAKAAGKPVDGVKPKSVRAFIVVGDGEIPVATVPIGKDGYFRLRLPTLPEGASYHLVASGQSESGQTVYVHTYDITASDPKVSIQLPKPPEGIEVTERTRGPAFSWEPSTGAANAYRVAIESVGQDGDTLWEGWTSGTAIRLPNLKEFGLLKEGESYRYSLTAIQLEEKGKLDFTNLAVTPWAASGMTRPATFEVQRLKPGQKPTVGGPAKPLKVPVSPARSAAPTAKPVTKPTPKPSPTPKNTRIKPLSDI